MRDEILARCRGGRAMGEQLQAVRQGLKPCTFYRNVNQESLTTTVNQKLSEYKMAIGCFLVNCS